MRARRALTALSLGLGLLIGTLFWRQISHLRRRERRDVWLEYVRGPLALAARASTEGNAALGPGPSPARGTRLTAAAQDMAQAWSQAAAMQPDFQADAFFYDLDQSLTWYDTAHTLAYAWPGLERGRSRDLAQARAAFDQVRDKIARASALQWARLQAALPWPEGEREFVDREIKAVSVPWYHKNP